MVKTLTRTSPVKQASVGSSPDQPYEQAFASIAHASLQSRVPTLMEYEVGFQLLDKSRDGSKALGAFGFKVGDRDLLMPVVYSDGEVKGHEMIYVPDQDICVPSTEAWVSYLTQKQPDNMGETAIANRNALGIRQPPLTMLTRSPLKFASARVKEIMAGYPEWCHEFLLRFAKLASCSDKELMERCPGLDDMLGAFRPQVTFDYIGMLENYPAMKTAAMKVNVETPKILEKSIDVAKAKKSLPRLYGSVLGAPKPKIPALKILYYNEVAKAIVPYDLSDSDKKKLADRGYIVQDKRLKEQKPDVFPDPVNQEALDVQNPTHNCLATVLVRPCNFKRCLVLVQQAGDRFEANSACIIDPEGKNVIFANRNAVFVDSDADDIEATMSYLKSLPEASSIDGNDEHIVVLQRGNGGLEATAVLSVNRALGKYGRDKLFDVAITTGGGGGADLGLPIRRHFRPTDTHRRRSSLQLRVSEDAETIRYGADEIVVPANAKVLRLKSPFSAETPLHPADLRDISNVVWRKLDKLEVHRGHSSGREYRINLDEPVTKEAAALKLISQYQIPEDVAETMLEQVEKGANKVYGVRKAADSSPWFRDSGDAAAPDYPWDQPTGGNDIANPNVTNDSTAVYKLPVPGLMASANDPSVWDPRNLPDVPYMQQAMQAASKGQRDVFNASSIKAIANRNQSGDMGPILKAMDALGQRYLAFIWQRDSMNDQYGAADAGDIEDSILENFEGLGEMVIAMYERDLKAGDDTELLKAKLTVHAEDTGE